VSADRLQSKAKARKYPDFWQDLLWNNAPTHASTLPTRLLQINSYSLRLFGPGNYAQLIHKFGQRVVLRQVDWTQSHQWSDIERVANLFNQRHLPIIRNLLENRPQENGIPKAFTPNEYFALIQYFLLVNANQAEVWDLVTEIQNAGIVVPFHTACAIAILGSAQLFAATTESYVTSNAPYAESSAMSSHMSIENSPLRLPRGVSEEVNSQLSPLIKFLKFYSQSQPGNFARLLRLFIDVFMRQGYLVRYLVLERLLRTFPFRWAFSDVVKSLRSWAKNYRSSMPTTAIDRTYMPFMIVQTVVLFLKSSQKDLEILAKSAQAHSRGVNLRKEEPTPTNDTSNETKPSVSSEESEFPTHEEAVKAAEETFRDLAYVYTTVLTMEISSLCLRLKPLLREAGRLLNKEDAPYTIQSSVMAELYPRQPERAIEEVMTQMRDEGLNGPSESHFAHLLGLCVTEFRHDNDCFRRVLNYASKAGHSLLDSVVLRVPMTLHRLLDPNLAHHLRSEIVINEPKAYLKPWDTLRVDEQRRLTAFILDFAARAESLPLALTLLDFYLVLTALFIR